MALAAAAIVWTASPASAHAVLLRTEPSPQQTVERDPSVVRLFFSEPVEAAFGAVRVFDVDGHRVDDGRIRRTDGDREVEAPARMRSGTFTVTWRVTSADGHTVHGGFSFYVGTPSTISAVAVSGEGGGGRLVGWGYGAVRFAWFTSLSLLVGLVVVRRWVWTPAVRAAGLGGSDADTGFRRRFVRWLPRVWVVLLVAGAATLVFQAASVSGLSLAAAARPSTWTQELHTAFGHLWLAAMALTVALVLPIVALVRRRPTLAWGPSTWIPAFGAVVAGLCLVSALNGHARTLGRAGLAVPALAVHLLAVTVWAGGLVVLVAVGGRSWRALDGDQRGPVVRDLVRRFGRLAGWAAGVVLVTGVVNTIGDFASVSDLWRVGHGRVVAAKVALVVVALLLAARHHWGAPARLAGADGAGAGAGAVRSFGRTAAIEGVVLVTALGLGAALVAMVPGRSLALAARGPVNQERQAGSYTAQLLIDPTAVGANQVHVTFVGAAGLAAADVTNADVRVGRDGGTLLPLAMRLISPGHFVGDATLAPGRYRVAVTAGTGPGASTTFTFRVRPTDKH